VIPVPLIDLKVLDEVAAKAAGNFKSAALAVRWQPVYNPALRYNR
jgi:hypothetical protein